MQRLSQIRKTLEDPYAFSQLLPATTLRHYQADAAAALAESIDHPTPDRLSILLFSRQAGKDETIAQLITWLLLRHSRTGGSIVLACPTQNPQAKISLDRTFARARAHPFTRDLVRRRDNVITIGEAKATFVGAMSTSARGQTASIALIANESQDIPPDQWDAVFDPMAASTNAPTIFAGTIWTADTLLSRQLHYAEDLERQDGRRRIVKVDWRGVAKELPAYGERVRARIKQLGPGHPFIRTEYELVELDAGATLFTEQRLGMLQGTHPRQRAPIAKERVAFLIDVAGADEAVEISSDGYSLRDSTIITVVELLPGDTLQRYRILDRVTFTNIPWATIEGAISMLKDRWQPVVGVIDATGIGHGMWQRLQATHKRWRLEPFVFTSTSKSDIGWRTLGIIDSGRVAEYAMDDQDDTQEHWWQLRHLTSAVRPGPSHTITYGIPASVGHDDSALSFMLIGHLDTLDLRPRVARGS